MARVTLTQVGAFTTEVRDKIEAGLSAAEFATKVAASPGVAGQIAVDATYIYVCTAANTWLRIPVALTTI